VAELGKRVIGRLRTEYQGAKYGQECASHGLDYHRKPAVAVATPLPCAVCNAVGVGCLCMFSVKVLLLNLLWVQQPCLRAQPGTSAQPSRHKLCVG
jgi:hypothetical protein